MARRKQNTDPSCARLAMGMGMILLALVLFKTGAFTKIGNMLVGGAPSRMQKVTEQQREKSEARQNELLRERAERVARRVDGSINASGAGCVRPVGRSGRRVNWSFVRRLWS